MAATSKHELLLVTQKEYDKLTALIGSIPDETALAKRDNDTSIKDIIGHRAHWIDLFLGWYTDGQAGKKVAFPAEGYKWSDLKRYNADLRRRQLDLGWTEAVAALRDAHSRLIDFIEDRTDSDLYGGPMKGGNNAWTPGRWADERREQRLDPRTVGRGGRFEPFPVRVKGDPGHPARLGEQRLTSGWWIDSDICIPFGASLPADGTQMSDTLHEGLAIPVAIAQEIAWSLGEFIVDAAFDSSRGAPSGSPRNKGQIS